MKDWDELWQEFCSGRISREEYQYLKETVNKSSDEKLHALLQEHWDRFEDGKPLPEKKVDAMWNELRQKMCPSFVLRMGRYWVPVAAMICILIMGAWMAALYVEKHEISQLASQNVTIRSGKEGCSMVMLPDGTEVRLNARSCLTYQQDFGHRDRKVILSGEGYFRVKRDEAKQFVVSTGFMDIAVLGTTFNVYTYEDKDFVEMSLVEGSVQVSVSKPAFQQLNVKPNEKVVYDKSTGKLELQRTDNRLETAWTHNELVFRHDRLETVLECLERKFGVNFVINDSLILRDTYTGVFDDESLPGILHVLTLHYGFKYKEKEDVIYIETEK